MTFIARLRAVCASVYDYEADYEILSPIPSGTDGLLTMRRIKLRSAVLARIDAAGEAFTLSHALKRCYRDLRNALAAPLKSPLVECLWMDCGPTTRWGGNAVYYFDRTADGKPVKPYTQPRFWRDPFVGATT